MSEKVKETDNELRQRAFGLYKAPFYIKCGHIFDSDGGVVGSFAGCTTHELTRMSSGANILSRRTHGESIRCLFFGRGAICRV